MLSRFGEITRSLGRRADAASSTGSANAKLKQLLAYIESTALFEGTTKVSVAYPVAAPVTLTGGAAYTYGAWAEVVAASTLAGHVLLYAAFQDASQLLYHVQIGTGGAGSEVAIAEVAFRGGGTTLASTIIPLNPNVQIPANARVAARVHENGGAGTVTIYIGVRPRPA